MGGEEEAVGKGGKDTEADFVLRIVVLLG